MSGDTPQPDEHVLDEREARQRIDEMRERIGARPRPSPTEPDAGTAARSEQESVESGSTDASGASLLDDPAAMAASMERAAHTDRLEAAIAERDERIERLEAEVARLRTAVGKVLAVLGEAISDVDETTPTGGGESSV